MSRRRRASGYSGTPWSRLLSADARCSCAAVGGPADGRPEDPRRLGVIDVPKTSFGGSANSPLFAAGDGDTVTFQGR